MSLDFRYAGEIYSLLCAFVWGCAVILLRKSGDHARPVALNVFKNVFALLCLLVTMLATGTSFFPPERTAEDWVRLLASGALGLGVADSLFLASLNRIGASRSAIVDCFYTPCLFVCSRALLGDPLRPVVVFAGVLIVGAVLLGTFEPRREPGSSSDENRARLALGVALGLLAMLALALAVVVAKPALSKADPWWAITVRLVSGATLPSVLGVLGKDRGEIARAFVPSRSWLVMVPAAFVGTYLSMSLWILGITFTKGVTTSGVLSQTSTIFTLVLAAVFLGERLTARKVLAIALGFLGGALVSLDSVGAL